MNNTKKQSERLKSSGIDWLGDIPRHWENIPVKRIARIINGSTPTSSESTYWDGDVTWFTPEDLGRNKDKVINDSKRKITPIGLANCGASLSPYGSIIISTRAPIGHTAMLGVVACCNQGCRILAVDNDKCDSSYLYYVIVSSKTVLQRLGKGTTFMELSVTLLGAHKIPFPPLCEQGQIAAFLDAKCGEIDALVAKKQRLLQLLAEERATLISRAVTRGLDPNAKLKNFGIDWLGNIPKHWEVKKLKYLVKIIDDPIDATNFLVAVENIESHTAKIINLDVDKTYQGEINRFKRGDTLFNKLRPYLAKVYYATQDGGSIGELLVLRTRGELHEKYLFYRVLSKIFIDVVDGSTYGTKMPRANWGDFISHLPIPVPPLSEQRQIVEYIECETDRIDAIVSCTEREIELLTEYRTALISEAVTGKLDVIV